jgi:ParB family chromosome partitioning protein
MIESVKLSKLRLSASNVRTAPDATLAIEPFAADLEVRGVLQNLLVTPVARSRGMYEVFDGGRRWRALNVLVERGVIDPEKYDVPVRIMKGDDAELTETSLAVSFQHMKLSPAEECRAFQHFLSGSNDIDGVAKRFGVTRRFIEGRLRLADLAEPIFAKLASGDITLDIAKAYASTGSHETQLRVWTTYGSSAHYGADAIRRVIATDTMRANEPIALLVGPEAYEAAGGIIDRDLFSDGGDRWLQPDIARTLAGSLMEAEAARLGTDLGLAWIRPIAGHSTWDVTRDLHRVNLPVLPMTAEEDERAEQIATRLTAIEEEMEADELTAATFAALEVESDALADELRQITIRPSFLPPELAPRVGTFLTLSQSGTMVLEKTYYSETPIRVTVVEPDPVADNIEGDNTDDHVDEGDAKEDRVTPAPTFRIEEDTATPTTRNADKIVDPENAAPGGKALSQILSDQLAMQKRDVLGAALIANPGVAMDYMLFAMVDGRHGNSSNDGTTIRADCPQDPILSTNMPGSRAREYLTEVHDGLDASWMESSNQVVRFEAFRALGDEAKSAWLAYIVATSLEAKMNYGSNRQNPLHGRLATILNVDVATWWRPTSENFFDRVSKGSLISLLHDVGGPALSSRHATEKKPDISASCQKLFAGEAIVEAEVKEAALKWLPNAMRFTDAATETAGTDDEQGDLGDLIEGGAETDANDEDGIGDDLATLIGDGSDDQDVEQEGDDVVDLIEHHNDDSASTETVAAE